MTQEVEYQNRILFVGSVRRGYRLPMATVERVQALLDRIQNLIDRKAQFILREDKDEVEDVADGPQRWPNFQRALLEFDAEKWMVLKVRKDKL